MNRKFFVDRLSDGEPESEFEVQSGEELIYLLVGLGESGRRHVTVSLVGEDAHAQILGVLVGVADSDIKIRTTQHHGSADTESDLLIKSVVFDNATIAYRGVIRIDRDAQRSNAYQRNENLMLGPDTQVDTRPELEILADDVRCTHGATVGKIDPEILFYLASRGLSDGSAQLLYLEGYFSDVLTRAGDSEQVDDIRAEIRSALASRTTVT